MKAHYTELRDKTQWVYIFEDEIPVFLGRVMKKRDSWYCQTLSAFRAYGSVWLGPFATRGKASRQLVDER